MSTTLHPTPRYESAHPSIEERIVPMASGWTKRVRRVSLGSVIAGVIVALSTQLLLSVLGLAIGAWAFSPATEENPFSGLGMGAGIWWVVTGILSLFLGGWVAGRLAGVPQRLDGAIHGLVTWGLVTLFTFWMLTTTVGAVLNATAWTLGQGISAASQGVGAVAGAAVDAGQAVASDADVPNANIDYERLGNQLAQTLRETGAAELQPDQLRQRSDQLLATAREAAAAALQNPGDADHQVDRVMDAFYSHYEEVGQAADQEAVASALAANTDLSEEEANRVVDRWQNQYAQTKQAFDRRGAELSQDVRQTMQRVERDVRVAGDEASDALGTAAMWSFAVMLLGMVAAIGGGAVGSPKHFVEPRDEHDSPSDERRLSDEDGQRYRERSDEEIRKTPR